MSNVKVGMQGAAPGVLVSPIPGWKPKTVAPVETVDSVENPEKSKYDKLWNRPEYRVVAPGEHYAFQFLKQAKPTTDAEVIDFGCGTGRGALMLALFGLMKVKMLDFSSNCLDEDVAQACISQSDRISFSQHDLTKTIPVSAPYGYCCDVMEHIPTDDVPKVLGNILSSANHVFFAISTVDDVMGALIGEPLHLTVKPMSWWLMQLAAFGAVVHWSHEQEGVCFIYCSAWIEAGEAVKTGKLNVEQQIIEDQTRQNILAGWTQARPHDRQNKEVVLLGGGPSMNGQLDKIRQLREDGGCILVTVNGAYHWAIDNGLKVSGQVILDAREFNSRFASPVMPDVHYLIASQVHPKTLEGLPKSHTYLWHSGLSDDLEKLIMDTFGEYYPIPGGSTVILRAIPLLRMLGYARIHVFGFDSCVMPESHHAYEQKENDGQVTVPVSCGGRVFECTPWMVSQASEFRDLVKFLGDEVELCVYGDGLISHIIATGATLHHKELNHGSDSMDPLQ